MLHTQTLLTNCNVSNIDNLMQRLAKNADKLHHFHKLLFFDTGNILGGQA